MKIRNYGDQGVEKDSEYPEMVSLGRVEGCF